MTIERNVLISILKLTRNGPVAKELISRDARVPTQVVDEIVKKFCNARLIQWKGNVIEASSDQRIRIAIHAIKMGADFQRACNFLEWDEFENIAATTLEANNFTVKKHFHFSWLGRRWEVDVLGFRRPIIVCVDCKHWHHGWARSTALRTVEAQIERTQALASALPQLREKVGVVDWKQVVLVPVVLSLVFGPLKFHRNTPIVPILQFQNFLNELSAHINSLTHFSVPL